MIILDIRSKCIIYKHIYILIVLISGVGLNLVSASESQVRVIDLAGAFVPDAEVDSSGTVHVAYLSDNNIYYVNSSDGGNSFSDPMRVNTEPGFASGGHFRGPDLALGKDNRVHVGWYNNANALKRPKNERGFMYTRMNAENTGFEANRNLTGGRSDGHSLAADSDGNVLALWVADGLFVSESNDGGATFSEPEMHRNEPCECCGTRSLYTAEGDFYYLYRDKKNNDRDMYLVGQTDKNDAAVPVKLNTETWHIEACPMSGSFLSAYDDSLLAAWERDGDIYFSRLDRHGEFKAPGEVKVATHSKFPVVLGNNSGLLMAWKKAATLYWQFFDLNGNQLGDAGSFSSSKPGRRPSGVVLPDGDFLLFP